MSYTTLYKQMEIEIEMPKSKHELYQIFSISKITNYMNRLGLI